MLKNLQEPKSQYFSIVQKDACGQIGVGPACCTEDIVNSYATPLGAELQSIIDGQLDNLTSLLTTSKQHIASE